MLENLLEWLHKNVHVPKHEFAHDNAPRVLAMKHASKSECVQTVCMFMSVNFNFIPFSYYFINN